MRTRSFWALSLAFSLFSCQNANTPQNETYAEVSPESTVTADPLDNSFPDQAPVSDSNQAKVELVFCLDATGSMSGLISTAKEKIWDIVTVMAQQQPAPEIRLGMVFYRDRGDDFITQSLQHTTDIDSIYTELLAMEAAGGGDSPESVNLALWEAVNDMKWSDDKNTYRSVFLVGDCPPHMDYNENRYPESCEKANEKRITINTIKLGNSCRDAISHFTKIAESTNGQFLHLDQNASDQVIATPYDDTIFKVSLQIDESRMYYGNGVEKEMMNQKKAKAISNYAESSTSAAASRAKYNMSSSGKKNVYGRKELLEDLKNEMIELEELETEALPEELKDLSPEELKQKVNELKAQRAKLEKELIMLNKKRDAYIDAKQSEDPASQSFSKQIFEILKTQASREGIIL